MWNWASPVLGAAPLKKGVANKALKSRSFKTGEDCRKNQYELNLKCVNSD